MRNLEETDGNNLILRRKVEASYMKTQEKVWKIICLKKCSFSLKSMNT